MAQPPNRLESLSFAAPPADGYFRVARSRDCFTAPPPARPLRESDRPVLDGNRWDDPSGSFVTLYCATTDEGAYGETIACFRPVPGLLQRIDAFVTGAPDPEFAPELRTGEVPAEYLDGRFVGLAPALPARFVDVDEPETHAVLSVELADELVRLGFKELDRGVMMGPDRRITRNVAEACYLLAAGSSVGGLRYESRLSGDWECWAVWEPFALDEAAQSARPVDRNDPALRAAARKLRMTIAPAS